MQSFRLKLFIIEIIELCDDDYFMCAYNFP